MGSIMLWFAFGFVMSDALFQDFLVFVRDYSKYRSSSTEHQQQTLKMHSKRYK